MAFGGGDMRVVLTVLTLLLGCGAAWSQTLKPGDTLDIQVLQDPKLDRRVVIDPSGQIVFPLAGRIRAAGSSPEAIENILKARLKENYRDDRLDVTVGVAAVAAAVRPEPVEEDLKPRVFVMGEVLKPGPYTVRRPTTLMQAIALAGGLGPYAAKSRIQVRRKVSGVEATSFFDYRGFESGNDLTGNIVLRPGDVIIVPERGLLEF
jgi:polysaccharide export outer membrane protein